MKTYLLISLSFLSTMAWAKPIKIGIMSGTNEKIFSVVQKIAKEKYHLDLDIIPFKDYTSPNKALENGEIDLNVFQTKEFLKETIEDKNYKITAIANTYFYPMGIFCNKIDSIDDIKDRMTIMIPNDLSNQSRALKLLRSAKIIKLKDTKDILYSVDDVIYTKLAIDITAEDYNHANLLKDKADCFVLNNDFVSTIGFNYNDILFKENINDSEQYVNVVVVPKNKINEFNFKEIVKVLTSAEVQEKIYQEFPNSLKSW